MLSSKQRQHLKALAHDKKPIVQVGQKGLTDAVVDEVGRALLDHELIKVKLGDATPPDDDSGDIHAAGGWLANRAEAELIAVLGKVAILFKPHPDKPRIRLPR